MNERNVDALAEALCWLACGLSLRQLPVVAHGFKVHEAYRSEAARLASRGVLVPSALTEREVDAVLCRPHLPDMMTGYNPKYDGYDVSAAAFIEDLEKAAKGESDPEQEER